MAKRYITRKYKKAILQDKGGGDWFLFFVWSYDYYYKKDAHNYEEFVQHIRGNKKQALGQAQRIARAREIVKDIQLR